MSELDKLRDENATLKLIIKNLLDFDEIRHACDCGPDGEGWQSEALMSALYHAEEAIK